MRPGPDPGHSSRWWPLAAALLIAAVYLPAVGFGFVNWDDDLHVYRNPLVLGGGPWREVLLTPRLGYPIPITLFTYRMELALVGLAPWLFHLTNVVLHVASAGMVYALGRRLGLARAGATAALLVFGLHPVAAEPVSWVTGRKDVLALFLGLAATLLFLQSCAGEGRLALRRAAALGLFVLAALAKPTALFLPLAWGIILAVGGSNAKASPSSWIGWRPLLRLLGPALPPAAGILLLAYVGQRAVGALQQQEPFTVLVRRIWYGLGYHLGLAIGVQAPLAKHIPPAASPPFSVMVDLLPLLLVLVVGVWRWRGRADAAAVPGAAAPTDGLGHGRTVVIIGLLWAAVAYLPSAGLVPLRRFLADSYVYPSLPGLAWAAGAALQAHSHRLRPLLLGPLLLAATAALAIVTLNASSAWRDGLTLWSSVYDRYPDSPQVCRNFGNAWFEHGRPEDALRVYRSCATRFGEATFVRNIALTLSHLGRHEEARPLLERLAAHAPGDQGVRRGLERARGADAPK